MPKVDGLEVLKQIRSNPQTKNLPVVILTCSREDADILQSYNLGCNAYVRKPVDFDQFAEAVKQLGLFWLVLNETPPQKTEKPNDH
jgi:two-component system response regulator